ncbi:MAG: serine/threonine-protein kinase [Gemmatimonadaceae bacterium]|jgi:serine/threonine protein kinase/tetratricopeptide (TPR) repeat protein|nr:serine/threonine-protein kinase [Gemmatimonadaceae bacterium]
MSTVVATPDEPDVARELLWLDLLLDADTASRHAQLDAIAPPALRERVRALLDAAAAPGPLDRPAGPDVGRMEGAIPPALAARYTVERELGRGGMGRAVLAWEHKHRRRVVLKLFEPRAGVRIDPARFDREVRIVAALAHPHIVPLLDSGIADGVRFFVMPYLGGETLRARLERGPLPSREAVALLGDLADALQHAHTRGVVHRDLKPENVLVSGGHAWLLDFGVAKLAAPLPYADTLTESGLAIGTPRYMAPEQVAGDDTVGPQTDIYAWGLLACELLTARTDFVLDPVAFVRNDLRRLVPSVHPRLADLLLACVQPAIDDRPPSMASVLARLAVRRRRSTWRVSMPWPPRPGAVVGAIAVMVAGGLVAALGRTTESELHPLLAEPIAVAPLRVESPDSVASALGRYVADGISDGLSRVPGIRLVSSSDAALATARAELEQAPLAAALERALHVGTIITGTIYVTVDSLRAHAQLVDAHGGRVLGSTATVVGTRDAADSITAELRARMTGLVAALAGGRAEVLPDGGAAPPTYEAYRAFDTGMQHFTAHRYRQALAAFTTAASLDSTFTPALLRGARAAWNLREFAVVDSLTRRARQQADASPLTPFGEASLAYLEARLRGEGALARAAIERAAALAPGSRASFDHAAALLQGGYAREARAVLLAIDPSRGEMHEWSSYWTQRVHAHYLLGNHRAALADAEELSRRFPDRRVAGALAARALAALGDTTTLRALLVRLDSLPTEVYWSAGAARVVAAEELLRVGATRAGRAMGAEAVEWLTHRLSAAPTQEDHRYWLGSVLYDLGQDDAARVHFETLARAHPDRVQYRGLLALALARLGAPVDEMRWFGDVAPRDHGELLLYRARLAMVRGDVERAITLLNHAADCGVEGFAWIPDAAVRDLAGVAPDPRVRLLLGGR